MNPIEAWGLGEGRGRPGKADGRPGEPVGPAPWDWPGLRPLRAEGQGAETQALSQTALVGLGAAGFVFSGLGGLFPALLQIPKLSAPNCGN